MSLLNQMLKDLAARQPAGGPAAVRPALPARSSLRVGPLLLLVLLAAVVGAAAGYWWLRPITTPPTPASVATPIQAVANKPLPAVTKTPAEDHPPANLPATTPDVAEETPATAKKSKTQDVAAVQATTEPPASGASNPTRSETALPQSPDPSPASTPIKQPSRTTPAEQAADAYREGLRLAQAGRPDAAAERLAQAVSLQPENVEYRLAQAQVLLRAGRGEAAARTLQEGIRHDPDALPLVKLYAGLQVSRNDSTAALAALHGANPPTLADDPAFHALLAAAEQGAGNHAAAADTYRALLAHNPAQGEWWAGLGIALENLNQPEDALAAYQHARQQRLPPALAQYVSERIALLK